MLKNPASNQKGMAVFEMIPIILVVILLLNFSLGFFGAIHTGIMQSIAARNYAFETFRHRANLTYFTPVSDENFSYKALQVRLHGVITSKKQAGENFVASSRPIDHFDFQPERDVDLGTSSGSDHTVKVQDLDESKRNDQLSVNPIWIKTAYGICLNAACGP